jgi:hypothetical protein
MPKKTPKKSGASLPSEFRAPIYVEAATGIGLWQRKFLTRAEIVEQASKQIDNKFKALMKHYRIPINSSDRWKHLSRCLAEELGLMVITLERPKGPGAPRIWLKEGDILVKRMDEIIAQQPECTTLEVAAILKKKYPNDYKRDLTKKSLVNRYGEAKLRSGTSLSSSLAEIRATVGQQLRQHRARRKRGKNPNVPSPDEKYWAAFLRRLQVI